MRRNLLMSSIAGVFALAIGLSAQNPPSQPPGQVPPSPTQPAPRQPSTPPPPASADQAALVTIEGCLMREQDIPGRQPNVAERAGIQEDFILASARVVKGSASQTADATRAAQPAPGQPGSDVARTSGGATENLSPMYDVKNLDSDRLKPLVGKRVQIEGRLSDTSRSPSAAASQDLVDIQGSSIKEIPGQCPAR